MGVLSLSVIPLLCVTAVFSGQTTVHVVFMNHLDIGYNGISPKTGFINNVLNQYFLVYFDRAARLAMVLESKGYEERFIYTTHPWLVSMYMDCPEDFILAGVKLECPTAAEKETFTKAVQKGYITWHAGPMNLQPENSDETLFEFGIQLGKDLDKRFGIVRKTRVLSQRDVPGMTQSVIPILKRQGVIGVSVGVNPMTSPPAVPSLFVWKHGDADVIATWHAGGYPNNPGPYPSSPGGLSKSDCVVIDKFDQVLCFAFRTDNSGPPLAIGEILGYYDILRAEFPGANIKASTLDAYFATVEPIKASLEVKTMEIADTWIQGIASDPKKTADYRVVARVLKKCLKEGMCNLADSRIYKAYRLLIKLPEHTWGLPSVNDNHNWTNAAFYKARSGRKYVNCSMAWSEQRDMILYALAALEQHPVAQQIRKALGDLKPVQPDLQGYKDVSKSMFGNQWKCGSKFQYSFGEDGSLAYLVNGNNKWATKGSPLARFMYRTYNESDFNAFGAVYNYNGGSAGFYKRGADANAHPDSTWWNVSVKRMLMKQALLFPGLPLFNMEVELEGDSCDFYLQMSMDDAMAVMYYGAPVDIWMRYTFNIDGSGVDVELQWFDKTSTRLPEAFFMSFTPAKPADPNMKWSYKKMGLSVDPHNVVLNGSQYQHVADSVSMSSKDGTITIESLDTPLACPITDDATPTVFSAPLSPIKNPISGMAYNIYNNIWDTNYILWYPYTNGEGDEDFKARYRITFT